MILRKKSFTFLTSINKIFKKMVMGLFNIFVLFSVPYVQLRKIYTYYITFCKRLVYVPKIYIKSFHISYLLIIFLILAGYVTLYFLCMFIIFRYMYVWLYIDEFASVFALLTLICLVNCSYRVNKCRL